MTTIRRLFPIFGLTLALFVTLSQSPGAAASVIEAWLAPDARLWPRWQAYDPSSLEQPDHSPWDRWLARNVTADAQGLNRIDYGKVTPEDRAGLTRYIADLTAIAVSTLNRDAQRAFWINLYNAATIDLVLTYYPVATIRDIKISPGFLNFGPWDKKLLTVESAAISLNDIEHRILRPIWNDPRIHYALNCASVSCPNLQTTAFTAGNTQVLLDAAARTYINSGRAIQLVDGKFTLSSIYNWFSEDFGGTVAAVISHISTYAEPGLAARLAAKPRFTGYSYDWDLNDSGRPN